VTAVVITVLNAYSGFALVAEGLLWIQLRCLKSHSNAVSFGIKRFHARQPVINHSWVSDWSQRFHFVIYYGTHSPMVDSANSYIPVPSSALP
jgi:hypothetical protein